MTPTPELLANKFLDSLYKMAASAQKEKFYQMTPTPELLANKFCFTVLNGRQSLK